MVGFGGPVTDDSIDDSPRPRLSLPRIIALTICFLGVQFGWALQIAFSTPIFLELGVPKTFSSYAWLAGPISGFLVQPTVGVLSDRCTSRFGRRKPFIFIGTVFIIIGELLISNAVDLGVMFGDHNGSTTRAIIFALIGFWVLDLANNTVQGPCRALLADIAPKDQQNLGGACFSVMLGLGNLFGYTLGGANLIKIMPFFGTNLRAVFTIAMINLIICVAITLFAVQERILDKSEVVATDNPFVTIFKGVKNMPPAMARVCVVQFFTWMGWFTYLLYITTWVGENIFHGDPDGSAQEKDAFAAGTRAGSIGLAINAVVAVLSSVVISPLSVKIGIKPIYCVAQVILAICLLLPIWVTTEAEALILIAGFGIPWAVVMVFPFTLVSYAVPEAETGLYMGVLNIFVVLPQLLIALTIGFIMDLFGGNVASALATGGVFALISAGLVWILNTSRSNIETVNTRAYQPLSE